MLPSSLQARFSLSVKCILWQVPTSCWVNDEPLMQLRSWNSLSEKIFVCQKLSFGVFWRNLSCDLYWKYFQKSFKNGNIKISSLALLLVYYFFLLVLAFYGLTVVLVHVLVLGHQIIVQIGETGTSSYSPNYLKKPKSIKILYVCTKTVYCVKIIIF